MNIWRDQFIREMVQTNRVKEMTDFMVKNGHVHESERTRYVMFLLHVAHRRSQKKYGGMNN